LMRTQPLPIVCDQEGGNEEVVPAGIVPSLLREAQTHYSVSLVAAEKFLGILTLTKRLTHEPFSVEDRDLLKTVADQTASSLFNVTLSQQLIQAKETETFQTLSAFFLHDLKNLAAMLSLTMQNLPTHYDDPEFRADALRVVGNSVDKINSLCSRLSLLTRTLELRQVETDVNELVMHTLADLNGAVQATIIRDLHPVPRLSVDPEQLQKVLVNLILNANEATGLQGEIRVVTSHENGWDVIQVSDNGCGMSKEFVEQSLFRPFRTTKTRGLGIGLYQSKTIVEAHHGRIEVESEEGKGSRFRVMLPTGERV
jgi:putative PEP-CTERM system histidine kinase